MTDIDNSRKYAGHFSLTVAKTVAAMTSEAFGLRFNVILDSTNTQNWTHTLGFKGMYGYVGTEALSSGTITGVTCIYSYANIQDAATVTNLYGAYIDTPVVAGNKVINEYGIYIANQNTGATLNYAIYTNAGLVRFGDVVQFYDDIFTDHWLLHNSNTFIGVGVCGGGNLAHGGGNEGYYNLAIGGNALYSVTTGYRNAAIGYNAMLMNDTGNHNSAIGFNALRLNADGIGNLAIGAYAMDSNDGGSFNSGIGYAALYGNTEGSYNLGIGYVAGRYQSDGTSVLQTPEYSTYLGAFTKSGCLGNAAAICDTIVNDTGIDGGDDGTYNGIATTATEGNGDDALTVNVTIAGGIITVVAVNVAGTGYRVNDTITISGLSDQVPGANDDGTFDIATVGEEDTITNETVIGYNAIGHGSNTITLGNTGIVTRVLRGNVGIDTSTFGAGAVNVLAIPNGTPPAAAVADEIQIYSKDSSDGAANATLALMLEQAVEVIGTFTPSHKIKVWLNGTEYWLQLDAV